MLRLKKLLSIIALFFFVIALTSCDEGGGGSSSTGTNDAPSVVVSTSPFAANGTCANGGIEITSGIDDNGNGVLDDSEVDNTQTVCNGTDGASSLVSVTAESSGSNCTYGGYKIETGLDTNNNDILDPTEVLQTQYICNGNTSTNPTTILVPDDYSTIQDAIDAAFDGDTILVSDGTYTENIDFKGKAITLQSVNGAGSTTIDGGANGSVVYFMYGEDINSVLDGFTITNGSVTSAGGGILCWGHSSPTIKNCIVTDNIGGSISGCTSAGSCGGGGIACFDSSPVIINCKISNNTTLKSGGGVIFDDGSSPVFINCIISKNSAYSGGGIFTQAVFSLAKFINCTISGNTATTQAGGGFYAGYSTPSITVYNCIFWGNTAATGGNEIDGILTVEYSDIQGGWTGTGNIDADPLFVNAAGGDYHLKVGSPCIDVGTSTGAPTDDIDENVRPTSGTEVDMGADETSGIDIDGDNVFSDHDCDDTDSTVYPGATEICNGVDDNCDGQIDEGC
jgi:hypothetical protein